MKMIRVIFFEIMLMLFGCATLFAHSVNRYQAYPKEAKLYFSGAHVVHEVEITLSAGSQEVEIDGISSFLDPNSIKISIDKGVVVSSFEFSKDFLKLTSASLTEKKLQDSIAYYEAKKTRQQAQLNISKKSLELLEAGVEGNFAQSKSTLTIEQLASHIDFFQKRSTILYTEVEQAQKEITFCNERLKILKHQLQDESLKHNQSTGVLHLNLNVPLQGKVNVTISYFTFAAYWEPYYDIQIPKDAEQASIKSKAKIVQTTGLDWKNVRLTLATAQPNSGGVAPELLPWLLQLKPQLRLSTRSTMSKANFAMADHVVVSEDECAMAAGNENYTETQQLFLVNGQLVSAQEAQSIIPSMIKSKQFLSAEEARDLYGVNVSQGVIDITTKSMSDFVDENESIVNQEFKINMPYDVPGNGRSQVVDINEQFIPLRFYYYLCPKLTSEAFLMAELQNWQTLQLQSGDASITYDGTYLGKTFINAYSVKPTLDLTLITDNRIVVSREKLKDFSQSKILGNERKITSVYRISVQNNTRREVDIELHDQYPITSRKDVQVSIVAPKPNATYEDKDRGFWEWKFVLSPSEIYKVDFGYEIRVPKELELNL